MIGLWEKVLALEKFEKKNTLPDTPGVYFFLDAEKKLLYIGKATEQGIAITLIAIVLDRITQAYAYRPISRFPPGTSWSSRSLLSPSRGPAGMMICAEPGRRSAALASSSS